MPSRRRSTSAEREYERDDQFPIDSPEWYADAWRVKGEDGTVYGVRELTHDDATEQPFTRSLSGVEIPDGVFIVVVEGQDQVNGWGGETIQVAIPGR